MIEVQGLTKEFGPHRAIEDITFSAEKGEVVGFLGPNGAGKTTTMRILTCFFPPTRGKASICGFDCFEDSLEVRRRIGYLPETVPLYRDMVVRDYLEFVGGIKGLSARDVKQNVNQVIDECGVEGVAHKRVSEISRGYRQRVGLAQALVNNPEVLILDEPTVGLDPRQILEIRKLIKNLAGKRTVILSTHILPEVSMICGRVIIVNQGRLVAVDTPDNLTAQLQKSTRLRIRISGEPKEVMATLSQVSGVKEVTADPAEARCYLVKTTGDEGVGKRIAPAIINKGWDLIEMRADKMSLEEVFIKLVTQEENAA
ncbi:MAG: ATP-binding cassette domain-containing protein [Magnetococcales bacterium]|nr:ATP-binding cassette domain-containing protein [Magnetococcales bacterium]